MCIVAGLVEASDKFKNGFEGLANMPSIARTFSRAYSKRQHSHIREWFCEVGLRTLRAFDSFPFIRGGLRKGLGQAVDERIPLRACL